MAFTINKNLIFIVNMQLTNFSLGELVKHFSDDYFKYLSQEFTGEQLKLVNKKKLLILIYGQF